MLLLDNNIFETCMLNFMTVQKMAERLTAFWNSDCHVTASLFLLFGILERILIRNPRSKKTHGCESVKYKATKFFHPLELLNIINGKIAFYNFYSLLKTFKRHIKYPRVSYGISKEFSCNFSNGMSDSI